MSDFVVAALPDTQALYGLMLLFLFPMAASATVLILHRIFVGERVGQYERRKQPTLPVGQNP